MKIGEFAEQNNVTAKMLRHYDEIGLLKPSGIHPETGYRSYAPEQSHPLNWILILKNLDFTLVEIKGLLSTSVPGQTFLQQLIRKRIEIASSLNEQIKKNIPNMEMFLDTSAAIASSCANEDHLAILRLDLNHFKQINDNYGFDVGDNVIVACYRLIESGVETRLHHAAIGRAHGDEFVVLAKADRETVRQAGPFQISELFTAQNHNPLLTAPGCRRMVHKIQTVWRRLVQLRDIFYRVAPLSAAFSPRTR